MDTLKSHHKTLALQGLEQALYSVNLFRIMTKEYGDKQELSEAIEALQKAQAIIRGK